MKARSRSIVILTVLFGYILLQFIWWEILLVRQNHQIIEEKQKIVALGSTDRIRLAQAIDELERKKNMRTLMIVGEGSVFLLLMLFGVYKIKQAMDREASLANQQKNFFLSITHELKTPIAATKLQLQTLQRPLPDEAIRQELLSKALDETERLNALIDNILLASRLESDQFTLQLGIEDIGPLVNDIVKRYYAHFLQSGELRVETGSDLKVRIDRQALPSLVTNLVDNAIKYSAGVRNISVVLRRIKGDVVLSVSDEGRGIPESERKKVFEKFYRSGDEETRSAKGTGLGLYIVKYLCGKLDADIQIKSNGSKGSVFEIRFPAA